MPQGLAISSFWGSPIPDLLSVVRDDETEINLTIVIPAKQSAEPGPEGRGVRPLLTGCNKSIQILPIGAKDSDIVNMAAIAAYNVS